MRRLQHAGILLIALLPGVSPPAPLLAASRGTPADLTLEQLLQVEIISGASKYEQKVTEPPASVTVVTSDEIRAFGYRREYAEPGSEEHLQDAIMQNGRNLRARVTWRF